MLLTEWQNKLNEFLYLIILLMRPFHHWGAKVEKLRSRDKQVRGDLVMKQGAFNC